MAQQRATLLLTRPEEQSRAFLAFCEAAGRSIDAVISPILKIVDVGKTPDLEAYAALVITSQNAVSRLAREDALNGRTVFTVGARTAELAREAGAEAVSLGKNAEEFVENVDQIVAPCLHVRGAHTRGEIAAELTARGTPCEEAVIYDQVEQPLSENAKELLESDIPVAVPVFSPRSAALLSSEARFALPPLVVAMSAAVAEAWDGPGDIVIAKTPTNAAMREAVLDCF